MFKSKYGKPFGSKFAANRHSEAHDPGADKMGDGDKKASPETPSEDKEMPRTMNSGEAKFSNKEASKGVPDAEPKAMDLDEGSPDVDADPEKSRTDEEGESTGEDTVPDDVKDAAMQHGSASKIVVTHDKDTGRHAVASQHADGHMHQSIHKDAKSAHAAARHLGMPQQQAEPEPDEYSHLLDGVK
jgi:hypothetical protein